MPFFVCATAGTTVYGAWDPLHSIADICQRHKLWFHVDVSLHFILKPLYSLSLFVIIIDP